MDEAASFGYWVRRRRKALDLTQADLARLVGCAEVTIQKIEADERRPSGQIAALLAEHLRIAPAEHAAFLQRARGELAAPPPAPPVPAASPARHNLPAALTSFVGRTRELATTKAMLASTRLLTLTGPGGTGKTRLALALAAALPEQYPDGIWLVELAPLGDPLFVAKAAAGALGLREQPDQPLLATVAAHLRARRTLLLLDNCEHLIDAAAQLADELLRACPHLSILASSREPLGIAGEAVFRVPALGLPDPIDAASAEELARSEALQLFVERARAVQPAFALTAENARAVAELCQRVDGIPLAIELAAARVRVLTVAQIAARLHDRFRLLTGGSRTALPRHQTLQALIDWSYDLLDEDERALLRRLAVFMGGWTLEAAEEVCGGETAGDVLATLTRLVDKSLAQAEPAGDIARYRMLETIRQYALEKLAASGEADALRRRHAGYYLAFANPQVENNHSEADWLQQMEIEHDNLRAALRWAFEQPGEAIAHQLILAMGWFWYRAGHWREGRGWLERGRAGVASERTSEHAFLTSLQGFFVWHQGDVATGQAMLAQGLALARELEDLDGIGYALLQLMILAREQGDAARATELYEELTALDREHPNVEAYAWALATQGEVAVLREDAALATALLDQAMARFQEAGSLVGIAWATNHMGHVAQLQNDLGRAAELHEQSLALFRRTDQQGAAWSLESLGQIALAQGDVSRAQARFAESLKIAQNLSYKPGVAWCLAGLGCAATLDGRPERAARLWGAAAGLRGRVGCRPAPAARATYEQAQALARARLDADAFAAAWAAGEALPLEQAIAYALDADQEPQAGR